MLKKPRKARRCDGSEPTPGGRRAKIRASVAFTLVELIVVITVLSVLGTVGFLSMQGYTKDASATAVRTNLKTLASSMSSESAINGDSLRKYVEYSSWMVLSGASFSGTSLVPGPYGAEGTNYSAGTPNFGALRLDGMKFRNPDGTPFHVWALDFTETLPSGKIRSRSFFQLAGFPNSGTSEAKIAIVDGTYPASTTEGGTSSGLIAKSNASTEALMDGAIGSNAPSWNVSGVSYVYTDASGVPKYPSSCNALLTGSGTFFLAGSVTASGSSAFKNGRYLIDPDEGGNPEFSAYCDMTNDGGGWTLVMQANMDNSPTTASWNTTASVGTYSDDYSSTFKFSDTTINTLATNRLYRTPFRVDGIPYVRYYGANCSYSHTSKITECRKSYSSLSDAVTNTTPKISVNDWPPGWLWDGDSSWQGNVTTNWGGTFGHTWCIEQGSTGRKGYCWNSTVHGFEFGTVTEAKWQMYVR